MNRVTKVGDRHEIKKMDIVILRSIALKTSALKILQLI